MRSLVGCLGVTVLALVLPWGAVAQERPGAVCVLGGVTVTYRDGASDGKSQIDITAPGGTSVGWSVAGGVVVARHVSLEGEWSWSGIMTAREPSRYGLT